MALYNQDSPLRSSLLVSSSHNCPLWWRTRQTPASGSQTQCRSCRSRPCGRRGTCTCFHTLSYILKFHIMKKQPRWCQKIVLPTPVGGWRGCIARSWQMFSILGNLCNDPGCFVYGGVALHLRVELETKVRGEGLYFWPLCRRPNFTSTYRGSMLV